MSCIHSRTYEHTQVLEDAIAEHRQRLESGSLVISQEEAAALSREELEEAVRLMEQVATVCSFAISHVIRLPAPHSAFPCSHAPHGVTWSPLTSESL